MSGRPLVLAATNTALEQARRLGVSGCLENRVEETLRTVGPATRDNRVGRRSSVLLRQFGVLVVCERVLSPMSSKKGWRPVECRRIDPTRRLAA
ncbi:MAG: hypothetical protein ACJ75L_10520 [Gaiellaceae bacterium]